MSRSARAKLGSDDVPRDDEHQDQPTSGNIFELVNLIAALLDDAE